MEPSTSLPLPNEFSHVDDYVNSLLQFTTTSELFQTLCGGVHILDFFTRQTDVYTALFPETWRQWFDESTIEEVLHLLMRQDLAHLPSNKPSPPLALLQYIKDIRKHTLRRDYRAYIGRYNQDVKTYPNGFPPASGTKASTMPGKVSIGMKPKKRHEVENFAAFVYQIASKHNISHLVDFGSGQNYLGRALASQPYNRDVIAIESKEGNIQGAQHKDRKAKVGKDLRLPNAAGCNGLLNHESCNGEDSEHVMGQGVSSPNSGKANVRSESKKGSLVYVQHRIQNGDLSFLKSHSPCLQPLQSTSQVTEGHQQFLKSGGVRYDAHGNGPHNPQEGSQDGPHGGKASLMSSDQQLVPVSAPLPYIPTAVQPQPRMMVISLHSCGNLIHHGLRSLLLNDFVIAVAMIGCCYNLMTERLGPGPLSTSAPFLRTITTRVEREASAFDPHGFPLSQRLCQYKHHSPGSSPGIRFNITARMMAVQAPQNWTRDTCDDFFQRHFFRALLQRIFLDRGVVMQTNPSSTSLNASREGSDPASASSGSENVEEKGGGGGGGGGGGATDPIVIGSLRKSCYISFRAYVRGAASKLAISDSQRGLEIAERMSSLTDEEIDDYETRYQKRKKDLSVAWSLMAFSAGLVEACIVVDRYLFLKEQKEIEHAWVQPVFDYALSPRNLVVVGVKKKISSS